MDQSYIGDNQASRERLWGLIARLGDDDFEKSVGYGWTVGAALAHLAHWDRNTQANLEEWERTGVKIVPTDPDPINDGLLPQWLATPPKEVTREVLAAAEAIDQKIEKASPELIEEVLAQRPRAIFRSRHRNLHREEIERALGK
jgi:uncharacterized damage-inducible protein DinB